MPMLGSRSRHVGCSVPKGIQWYLEEKAPGRALARGFCNLSGFETARWDKAMDRLRIAHGNHLPYRGRKAVQYLHFDLSPDPADRPSAEEVLEYAKEWAAHFFGDGGEDGALGCFQCAIVVHDDNENGIVHAHVIVNNTDLGTGRRLHIGDRQNERDLPDYAQDIARERGWRYFDNTPDQRWIASEARLPLSERRATLPEGSSKSIAERRLGKRGEPVWKDEMRAKVGVAKNVSRTEPEFLEALRELGVSARLDASSRDYVFGLPDEGRGPRESSGRALGKAFLGPGVEGRRTLAMQMPSEDAARLRRNVLAAMERAQSHSVAVPGGSGVSQREIAVALATMRKWRITNEATCDLALSRCGALLGRTPGAARGKLQKDYARISEVGRLARRIGLFEGVGDGATGEARLKELEAAVASGAADGAVEEELARMRLELHAAKPARVPRAQPGGPPGWTAPCGGDPPDRAAARAAPRRAK